MQLLILLNTESYTLSGQPKVYSLVASASRAFPKLGGSQFGLLAKIARFPLFLRKHLLVVTNSHDGNFVRASLLSNYLNTHAIH